MILIVIIVVIFLAIFRVVFPYDTQIEEEKNLGKELLNPDWSRLFAPPAKQTLSHS